MESYKQEFIDFMVESHVLKFGEFTLKSGRKSPFFMNAGAYVTGSQLKRLGEYYAKAIHDKYGDDFDVLFGPAYKGIPLGVVTAIAYSELYGKEIRYCSDRKEEKDHGADKGSFLGSKLQDGDRVVMIEDVTTSGKSMEETVPKVRGAADVTIVGLMVSLDRMEVGKGGVKCALDEVKDLYGKLRGGRKDCKSKVEEFTMKKIGFIGVGIMGKSMVRNLMKTGYELHIYARTKAKVDDVISEGAIFHESIKECVPGCDAVITIVGFPRDVEEVYFDEGGILENADPGTYLIDMTTTSPMLAEKISKEGTEKGFHVLDAPVTGGDTGAKNATLSILVGGEKEDYEACMELFKAMGTNINYQGKAGCGQHAKLANQIMIAGALSGVCEAFSYAQAKGLDLNVLFDSVSTGAAGSKQLDVFGPKIIAGDYAPGFFMKHFIKDMKLALTEANMSGLSLEVLSLVLSNYEELAQEGLGDLGTQALIKYYDVQDVEE